MLQQRGATDRMVDQPPTACSPPSQDSHAPVAPATLIVGLTRRRIAEPCLCRLIFMVCGTASGSAGGVSIGQTAHASPRRASSPASRRSMSADSATRANATIDGSLPTWRRAIAIAIASDLDLTTGAVRGIDRHNSISSISSIDVGPRVVRDQIVTALTGMAPNSRARSPDSNRWS